MTQMRLDHYRDLIVRAVQDGGPVLDQLAARMDDAAQAKQVMHAKGYGPAWSSLTKLASQVPDAKQK